MDCIFPHGKDVQLPRPIRSQEFTLSEHWAEAKRKPKGHHWATGACAKLLYTRSIYRQFQAYYDHFVICEVEIGLEAVEFAYQPLQDVVVMVITMPELNAVQATEQIRAGKHITHVVIFSQYLEGDHIWMESQKNYLVWVADYFSRMLRKNRNYGLVF